MNWEEYRDVKIYEDLIYEKKKSIFNKKEIFKI